MRDESAPQSALIAMLKKPHTVKVLDPRQVIEVTPSNRDALMQALHRISRIVKYVSSPYHRLGGNKFGQPIARRWYASKCPPTWTQIDADRELKKAILECNVCQVWVSGFPRFIWHLFEDVLYEARLSNEVQGHYHAYPLEDVQEWPRKFQPPKTSSI
jgi:hypothetical protein